ncbi:MAG: hypothetical protein DUD34_13585 [Lactobacillus sp.]|nr:MAG: hypothetical protein DUD34_13585 [Lactobacillus sp.]
MKARRKAWYFFNYYGRVDEIILKNIKNRFLDGHTTYRNIGRITILGIPLKHKKPRKMSNKFFKAS